MLKKYEKHDIEVVIDRLAVKPDARRRLTDSVETALALSGGVVVIDFVDLPDDDPRRERMFSEHLACLYDDLSFDELEPRSFSFNSPWGACPDCTGLGTRMEVDPGLVVPDPSRTLADGAIAPWGGGHISDYFTRLIQALGDAMGFTLNIPWQKLPAAARKALLYGYDQQVHVQYHDQVWYEQRSYVRLASRARSQYIQRQHAMTQGASSSQRAGPPGSCGARFHARSCHGFPAEAGLAQRSPIDARVHRGGLCALPIGELAEATARGSSCPRADTQISVPGWLKEATRLNVPAGRGS